jgi:hypothetical protein
MGTAYNLIGAHIHPTSTSRPSEASAGHRIASGDNLVRLFLMPRGLRGFSPSAVALGTPGATNFVVAAISRSGWASSRETPYPTPYPQSTSSCFAVDRKIGGMANPKTGQSKDRHNFMTRHCSDSAGALPAQPPGPSCRGGSEPAFRLPYIPRPSTHSMIRLRGNLVCCRRTAPEQPLLGAPPPAGR